MPLGFPSLQFIPHGHPVHPHCVQLDEAKLRCGTSRWRRLVDVPSLGHVHVWLKKRGDGGGALGGLVHESSAMGAVSALHRRLSESSSLIPPPPPSVPPAEPASPPSPPSPPSPLPSPPPPLAPGGYPIVQSADELRTRLADGGSISLALPAYTLPLGGMQIATKGNVTLYGAPGGDSVLDGEWRSRVFMVQGILTLIGEPAERLGGWGGRVRVSSPDGEREGVGPDEHVGKDQSSTVWVVARECSPSGASLAGAQACRLSAGTRATIKNMPVPAAGSSRSARSTCTVVE